MEPKISQIIERKNFHLIKYGSYYCMILFLDSATIELEDAEEIVALKETMYTPGEEMSVLVKTKGIFNISKDAMALLSDHDTPNNVVVSSALIVENLGLRMLANFYVTTVKPVYKTKIFRTFSGAMKWSTEQLNLYKSINV